MVSDRLIGDITSSQFVTTSTRLDNHYRKLALSLILHPSFVGVHHYNVPQSPLFMLLYKANAHKFEAFLGTQRQLFEEVYT